MQGEELMGRQGKSQLKQLRMVAKRSHKLRMITTGVSSRRFGSVLTSLEMEWFLVCSQSGRCAGGEDTLWAQMRPHKPQCLPGFL